MSRYETVAPFIITAFVLAAGLLQAYSADPNRTMQLWNGRGWKGWKISEKTSWIEGFTAGYAWANLRSDEVFAQAQPNSAKAVRDTFQVLLKTDLVEGYTNLRLAQEVDRVYSDDKNLDLLLDMAIAYALHRLNGAYSEGDLRGELGRFRALAVYSRTKESARN